MYDEVVAQYTGRLNLAPGVKIKSQDLLLWPRLIHQIIAHNILLKKRHYDEVTLMNMFLIDCMTKGHQINLPYMMMKKLIMAYDKKNKSLCPMISLSPKFLSILRFCSLIRTRTHIQRQWK